MATLASELDLPEISASEGTFDQRFARLPGLEDLDVRGQRVPDALDDLVRDTARLGVDDQDRAHARQTGGVA